MKRRLGHLLTSLALLAVAGAVAAQSPRPLELVFAGVDGSERVLGTLPGRVFAPRVSPDGQRVVFEIIETDAESGTQSARLWVAAVDDITDRTRVPGVDAPINWAGMWRPDGERLVFVVSGDGPDTLYMAGPDGSPPPRRLVAARAAESWLPDGSAFTYLTLTGERDYGVALLEPATGETTPLVDVPDSEQHSSAISPDGRWLAYVSNHTGRYEVWIAPLAAPDERFRVTDDGGHHPLWSNDGSSLYFDRDGRMYTIDVELAAGETPRTGEPEPLPITDFVQGDLRRQFDLMPDGRRFVLLRQAGAETR